MTAAIERSVSSVGTSEIYAKIVESIISQQELIIGPIAIERARSVSGLELGWDVVPHTVSFSEDPRQVINALVSVYALLFGELSVQVCKNAVAKHMHGLSADEVPHALR